MKTLKVRKAFNGSYQYFLGENGKVVTDVSFIEYAAFEGLYTVTKKNGEFFTFLPQADGNKTYMSLVKIIQQGFAVYLIS